VGNISYTPVFRHTDWVDNVDRVEAAGQNGFNIRFNTIGSDLRQLSTVVGQINTRLTQLADRPVPTVRLTLPPALRPTGGAPWVIASTGEAVVPPNGGSSGALNLSLPDGARLTTFRATGQCQSDSIVISLVRGIGHFGSAAFQEMVRLTVDTSPFDKSGAVDPSAGRVDNSTFRYFINAQTNGTSPATPGAVAIRAFQLTYVFD
jgi:hypothetical protein